MKDPRDDYPHVIGDVYFRQGERFIAAAYIKGESGRVYPDEFTATELRAIADHMEKESPRSGLRGS